jgi:teichuronic acid exporter
MTQDTLRHKTTTALYWSFVEAAGLRGVQFVIGIVLARLLVPEQFGLIGMLAVFIAIAQTFLDSGFGAALIQRRQVTQVDLCSIFYFNLVVGLVAAGLLCAAAPWIAAFYHQPILTPLTRVLSLTIVINGFGLIQSTLLARRVDFKTQTKVSLIANVSSGIIGVSLAAAGWGVWSLAIQQVCSAVILTSLLWCFSEWRPSLVVSLQSLREMFGFGSRVFASGLLNTVTENIYGLVIGKVFSARDLGFFTRATSIEQLPSRTLASMVGRVTFPVFSSIQDDPERLKRGLRKALTTLVLVNFPLMLGLALVAKPLVLVLLTEKWAPCVPYLRLLCVVGLLFPLHLINLNLLMAKGRSDLFFRLEVIKRTLVVTAAVITYRWGIAAMIYGQIAVSCVSYYINAYYTGKLLSYPLTAQLVDLAPYLRSALIMGGAVYGVQWLGITRAPTLLALQVLLGIVVYVTLCSLSRLGAFVEARQWALERARGLWPSIAPGRAT